jgi:rod shape-determining protein MreB
MATVLDIGVDLGTASVVIYGKGKDVVLNEPAVIAFDRDSRNVLAVGEEARRMMGRTPSNIAAIRPLQNGMVGDMDMACTMLRYFVGKVVGKRLIGGPRILISVPTGVNEMERHRITTSLFETGARRTQLMDRPVAAAIGAGLPIGEAYGKMIVDIGGGTADIAVIALSGVVESASIKIAGDQLNEAVIKHMRRKHNLLVGERTAEEMKKTIGCVFPKDEEETMDVKGRCLLTGLPKVVTVSSTEMMDAFEEPVERIMEAVHQVLERTPPELVADISTNGIVMTGGGSLVYGFDKLIEAKTGIATRVADDAVFCVAYGTGKALESLGSMQDGTMNLTRKRQMM